jgi:hypothetical protein
MAPTIYAAIMAHHNQCDCDGALLKSVCNTAPVRIVLSIDISSKWCQWSASCLAALFPQEYTPGISP